MIKLWHRFVAWLRGLFAREPAPGRFEAGSARSLRGWHAFAPLQWPSREYLLYIPRGHSSWRRSPLLVLCHGCKQSPEDIARGTRITALADARGYLVLLPRQKERANPWNCWNWFDRRTAAGDGEAAIVAAQIEAVLRSYRVDRRRVAVAGMSAGGALAAVIGIRYPQLVRGVAVHSGLACGAAASPMTAIRVLASGPDQDVVAIGAEARSRAPPESLPVPLLAVHGARDEVVVARHGQALVRQYLRFNGHPSAQAPAGDWPAAESDRQAHAAEGREHRIREWRVADRLVVRHIEVPALAHAWGGGDEVLPYNDGRAPDVTAMLGDFLDEIFQ